MKLYDSDVKVWKMMVLLILLKIALIWMMILMIILLMVFNLIQDRAANLVK